MRRHRKNPDRWLDSEGRVVERVKCQQRGWCEDFEGGRGRATLFREESEVNEYGKMENSKETCFSGKASNVFENR